MGQRGTKPVENLGHRITDLPGLPEEPPREICGDEYACEAWERFVPALNMLGHVCILNLPDVLTVCQAYSLARTAWEDLAEDGRLVVEGESSSYENPLFRVWVTANARMEKCLKNLGMRPGALQSLKPFGGPPRREPPRRNPASPISCDAWLVERWHFQDRRIGVYQNTTIKDKTAHDLIVRRWTVT